MSKVKWSQLRDEYTLDPSVSYRDLSRKYGVSKQSVVKRAVKYGWQALRQEVRVTADRKLSDFLGDKLAKINAIHLWVGHKMISVAMQAMEEQDLRPQTSHEALEFVKAGCDIERKAMESPAYDSGYALAYPLFTQEEMDQTSQELHLMLEKYRDIKVEIPYDAGVLQRFLAEPIERITFHE